MLRLAAMRLSIAGNDVLRRGGMSGVFLPKYLLVVGLHLKILLIHFFNIMFSLSGFKLNVPELLPV